MQETFGTDAVVIFLVMGIISFVILIALVPTIFYLCTLQKALNRCQPQNRAMQPGLVWLNLIPFFSMIWHFFVVVNIAASLEKEYAARNMDSEPAPGKAVGLAMCILNVCGAVPYVGLLTGIGGFVCWIIYWIQIADCSARLANADLQPLEPAAAPPAA
jgi:hypothetical protein